MRKKVLSKIDKLALSHKAHIWLWSINYCNWSVTQISVCFTEWFVWWSGQFLFQVWKAKSRLLDWCLWRQLLAAGLIGFLPLWANVYPAFWQSLPELWAVYPSCLCLWVRQSSLNQRLIINSNHSSQEMNFIFNVLFISCVCVYWRVTTNKLCHCAALYQTIYALIIVAQGSALLLWSLIPTPLD